MRLDLIGDGWNVIQINVSRNNTRTFYLLSLLLAQYVKSLIAQQYFQDTLNVKAVYLFGRVPVPYSGSFAPDGHVDHVGAWPADSNITTMF